MNMLITYDEAVGLYSIKTVEPKMKFIIIGSRPGRVDSYSLLCGFNSTACL